MRLQLLFLCDITAKKYHIINTSISSLELSSQCKTSSDGRSKRATGMQNTAIFEARGNIVFTFI